MRLIHSFLDCEGLDSPWNVVIDCGRGAGLSKDRCSNSYIDYIAYRFALCREMGRVVGDYMYQLRSTLFTQRFRS